ncbi:uncharacterized protein LOC128555740 isoform X1 [Mercenaria mercenaria]|uniref:uncharacterized protein LOC128555740 isoform X1 n=1 Tax=Mercenaria mercenaria TaxID=6596 RepID=UPI00234FA896|nr:uncharacterized protein LOC128555740 isoform X1 [Mercenaria mercenaria]
MLFADDMVILGDTLVDLQNSLDLLSTYCNKWGLEVNTLKTKIMFFRKRGPVKSNEKWHYNNQELDIVDNFNYLGIVFNYTGTFVLNQETLGDKGLKALNVLMNNIKGLSLKPSVKCQLFDAFVGSTLNYGCAIWGFGKSKEIERIHLMFCKSLLNVKTSSSNIGVYGKLGRYPLYINRYLQIIKYWGKIVSSSNILLVKLYEYFLVSKNNRNNWAYQVKCLLDNFGFSYVWNNPTLVDLDKFHLAFKERVLDTFKQNWCQRMNDCGTLDMYKNFKTSFLFEKYLDLLPFKYRSALARLRLSSHKLAIETGHYSRNRTDRNLRYCIFCQQRYRRRIPFYNSVPIV